MSGVMDMVQVIVPLTQTDGVKEEFSIVPHCVLPFYHLTHDLRVSYFP